ncbi:MAG: hypothetical protein EOP83_06085 [Verrucomicrobiaceae bacterium]|nr:MAG: hypothetical protein EOP83_06085 [Verrucomicrobiaceae bacterium]
MKASLLLLTLLAAACQPKNTPQPPPPESAEKQPSDAVPTPESFVGLTLQEAEAKAKEADLPHRVVRNDGEDFPVTRDYRPERLNFTVEKGVVTKVTTG